MSTNSINYIYSGSYLSPQIWQVFYDFSSISNGYLASVSGANSGCSGFINGSLSINNNSGYFNGSTYLKIQNSTGDLTNWTIICSFQKNSQNNGIIFSNFSSGVNSVNSGFVFGISANNRMYLESYSPNGPLVFQSPIILGKKNVVAVSKIGQALYFDYLNANTKEVESSQYTFSNLAFLNSNNWNVGGAPNAPSYFSGNNFSGIMDNFILINESLRPYDINNLFSGIFSSGSPPTKNLNYLLSLGMEDVTYLQYIDNSYEIDLYACQNSDNMNNFNEIGQYNRILGDYVSYEDLTNSGVNLFVNGVIQIPSLTYSISGFYDPIYTLHADYLPTGNQFFANQSYDNTDTVTYDLTNMGMSNNNFITGFSHDGSTASVLNALNAPTELVFFNGLKLVPNKDYLVSGGHMVVFTLGTGLYNGVTGTLFTCPNNTNISLIDSSNTLNSGNNLFARGTSELFLNGVRAVLGDTYLEISSLDYLKNTGIFPQNISSIFSNDTNFINTF